MWLVTSGLRPRSHGALPLCHGRERTRLQRPEWSHSFTDSAPLPLMFSVGFLLLDGMSDLPESVPITLEDNDLYLRRNYQFSLRPRWRFGLFVYIYILCCFRTLIHVLVSTLASSVVGRKSKRGTKGQSRIDTVSNRTLFGTWLCTTCMIVFYINIYQIVCTCILQISKECH